MTRTIVILSVLFAACDQKPIPSPSVPGAPCGLNADSCPKKMCCDRPYACGPNGSCVYAGGGNSGDYFGARKSVPQRAEK